MSEYTAKDIILSTKDKLGEISKRLERLEELTDISRDKRIQSVDYDILTDKDRKPEILCSVIDKNRGLKGIIKDLKIYQNLRIHGLESAIVSRDNNGNSYIMNDKYSLFIPERQQEEFGNISDEILSDEFVNNFLNSNWFYPKGNATNRCVEVYPNNVRIRGETNKEKMAYFNYFTRNNTAMFQTEKGFELTDTLLQELLNFPLDEFNFTEYRTKVIESSPLKNKVIIIPKFDTETGRVDFDVEEDEKHLYLIKK